MDRLGVLNLIRPEQLDFQVDTSHAQSARAALDWNSKKAGMCVSPSICTEH